MTAAPAPAATHLRPDWPEPWLGGDPAQGARIMAGRWPASARGPAEAMRPIWEEASGEDAIELQGFDWLPDLLAAPDLDARAIAQAWVARWTLDAEAAARVGPKPAPQPLRGSARIVARLTGARPAAPVAGGPLWAPALAARRVMAFAGQARLLIRGWGPGTSDRLAAMIAWHGRHLEATAEDAALGLPRLMVRIARLEAARIGREPLGPPTQALLADLRRALAEDGGLAQGPGARSPEALLTAAEWLARARPEGHAPEGAAMDTTAVAPADATGAPAEIGAALDRALAALRALRHADGTLGRFHGGGGAAGALDLLLASRRGIARPASGLGPMGIARLAAGRTTVLVDAALPSGGAGARTAHASTLAFELTSGRRPLIVSSGPGRGQGGDWVRAARATPSHSTLTLDGLSSARLGPAEPGGAVLRQGPRTVTAEETPLSRGLRVVLSQDAWLASHGLIHDRTLALSADGRALSGDDLLRAPGPAEERVLKRRLDAAEGLGLPVAVRFHLHPDVRAALAPHGDAVDLILRSGELWRLVIDPGPARLMLEPGVHLDPARPGEIPTETAVVTARVTGPRTRIRWTLVKAQGTPPGLRDLLPGDDWPDLWRPGDET